MFNATGLTLVATRSQSSGSCPRDPVTRRRRSRFWFLGSRLSGGPDVGPASEFKHPIQGGSSNGAPGRLGLGGARSQRIADHAPAGNKRGSVQQGLSTKNCGSFRDYSPALTPIDRAARVRYFGTDFRLLRGCPFAAWQNPWKSRQRAKIPLRSRPTLGGIGQFDLPFGERPDQGGRRLLHSHQ